MSSTPSRERVARWLQQLQFSDEIIREELERVGRVGSCREHMEVVELIALRNTANQWRGRPTAPGTRQVKALVMRYLRGLGYDYRSNYAINRVALLLLELCLQNEINGLSMNKSGEAGATESVL